MTPTELRALSQAATDGTWAAFGNSIDAITDHPDQDQRVAVEVREPEPRRPRGQRLTGEEDVTTRALTTEEEGRYRTILAGRGRDWNKRDWTSLDIAALLATLDAVRAEATAAAEQRLEALEGALSLLLEDTEHKDHDCGDEEWCPVFIARALLEDAGRDRVLVDEWAVTLPPVAEG